MKRKNILIINSGTLFPKVMAYQDRVIEMTKFLNKKHDVDIVCLYNTEKEKSNNQLQLGKICNQFYLLEKPNNTFLNRKILGALLFLLEKVLRIPREMIYPNWPSVRKKILKIIRKNNYDVIQIETWWQCSLFKKINSNILKVIDTHDVLHEKRILEIRHKRNGKLKNRDKLFLKKYRHYEILNTGFAELIVSISNYDKQFFQQHFPNKKHIMIPTGQDLARLLNYPTINTEKTILFYGSMGGEQNIIAFWRLYNEIYPKIKKEIPEIKLIVLGANPPNNIKVLNNGDSIIITDYVKDVREYIAKSSLMILPLVISGGVRSRIVEVMAMGVPIIGTHNALDGIGLSNSENCIIEDNNEVLASKAVDLLSNNYKLNKLSHKSQKFAIGNYSLEKTYGKLAEYYEKYIKNI